MDLESVDLSNVSPEQIADIIRSLKPDEINFVYSEWYKLARDDFNVFAQLVAVDDETGEPLRQAPVHRRWAELCDKHDRLLIWSSVNSGKCEAAGSRVLLSSGEWINVEDMIAKDSWAVKVLDPSTMTYRDATAKAGINGKKKIVRIETKTGRVLRVTENHPLFVARGWKRADQIQEGEFLAGGRHLPEVSGGGLSPDDAELLGYLVGDGGLTDPHRVNFTNIDDRVLARVDELCQKRGWILKRIVADGITFAITRKQTGKDGWEGVQSPSSWAASFGIDCLSKHKRIPAEVFRSSTEACAAFIAGYFACDGSIGECSIELSSASEGLIDDLQLLLLRLGVRSAKRYKQATCNGKKFDAWRLSTSGEHARLFCVSVKLSGDKKEKAEAFTARESSVVRAHSDGVPVEWTKIHPHFIKQDFGKFGLYDRGTKHHRKVVREYLEAKPDQIVSLMASEEVLWDEITSIEIEAEEAMTYSLSVDDPSHCYISSGFLSHNTTQLSILRTVWELGKDPTLRFAILSNTSSIAQKIVKAIANYIKNNTTVHEIFPNLQENPDGPWTNTELRVVGNNAKDPSVRAVGVHGALTSARVDRLIIDDILDPENTNTEANRKDLEAWYKAVATGRLSRRAKILVVGTAYHPKDLLHKLAKQKRWKSFRFPVYDSQGNIAWPEAWTQERIDAMREEMGPAEFARQMLCRARDDDEARFKQEWIDNALLLGDGLKVVYELEEIPADCYTFCGVDLAVSKKKRADETVFFTFMEDSRGRRRLLNIEAGKFTGPEIVQKIVDHYRRYGCTVVVEDNAAQAFVLQFAKDENLIPKGVVVPHTTTKAKRDPIFGVEGLAVELSQGKWIIPNESKKVIPQIDKFIEECLFYSPKAHTGDRLMSAYFARDKARNMLGNRGAAKVGMRVIGGEGEESTTSISSDSGGGSGEDRRSLAERLFDVKEPVTETEQPSIAPVVKHSRNTRPSVNLAAERARVAAIHEGLKEAIAAGRSLDPYEEALIGGK